MKLVTILINSAYADIVECQGNWSLCFCVAACNVTIHNRCRDTLANCAKMKQKVREGREGKGKVFYVWKAKVGPLFFEKLTVGWDIGLNVFSLCVLQQQKLALVRNSSALQNVALRTKSESIFFLNNFDLISSPSFAINASCLHVNIGVLPPVGWSMPLQYHHMDLNPFGQEKFNWSPCLCLSLFLQPLWWRSGPAQPSIRPTVSVSPCWAPAVSALASPSPRVSPHKTSQGEQAAAWSHQLVYLCE